MSYLGSEHQNKSLAWKLLWIRLLQSGKCLKAPNEGAHTVSYEYYELYFIHRKSIRKTQLTTKSLVSFFGSKEPYFSWLRKVDISRKKCGASRTKFCATFSEFKVYIFLLNVLLYLLVIF